MSYLPVWLGYFHSPDGLPVVHSTYTGRQLLPLSMALALVVLAGSVAVWVLPRIWVRLVGIVLLGCSLLMFFEAVGFWLSPELVLAAAMARDSKQANVAVVANAITISSWWIAALVGSLLAVVGSLITAFHFGPWPGMSARYNRSNAGAVTAPTVSGAGAWDALDQGVDPTDR
jgi:uncharacterized membrane protein (TIGR02234 family)